MKGAVSRLKAMMETEKRYDIPNSEVADLQLEAAATLFESRRGSIKYLAARAEESGITTIREPGDLIGLLFAHTTYKSYPEQWLSAGKWPILTKWVNTLSADPVRDIDLTKASGINDWIDRLAAAGHFLSCSSGTTGKSAILRSSAVDMAWAQRNAIHSLAMGIGFPPANQFRQFGATAVPDTPRNRMTGDALTKAFNVIGLSRFEYPVPPITLGQITGMVALRQRLSAGKAAPSEITDYQRTSQERQAIVDAAIGITADALIAARKDQLMISGMWGNIHKIAQAVRERGFDAKDFNPDNAMLVAGGLKGAILPENFRDYVFSTFNLDPKRVAQNYSMQEIATAMPRCKAGRYHIPPWLICLLLDQTGENLIPWTGGEMEGRAGFFDISLDGRWNGVISGDRISLTHETCDCGRSSPSIRDDIVRYADLAGGDKITCAGTVDAYVRGID